MSTDTSTKLFSLAEVAEIVRTLFPSDPFVALAVEVCLSATSALCIQGIEGCPGIILEGPASSKKTTVLRFFPSELKDIVYRTDHFTPAAFVSHMADKRPEELLEIDLLPRVSHKVFIVPEMRVVFSDKREELQKNLGILTRLLDGHGYLSDSGAHGQRGYRGDYKFCFLGATTPLSDYAWQELSNAGSRMLVLDMGGANPTTDELASVLTEGFPFEVRVSLAGDCVSDFLQSLWERTGGYGAVEWDRAGEDAQAGAIARLAQLTAQLRGRVERSQGYNERSIQGVQKENPTRLVVALANVARGHALANGRTTISGEDLPIVRALALNTCPSRRRLAFRCMAVSADGTATTRDIEKAVGCATSTALVLMEDLVALGVAEWDSKAATADAFQAKQTPRCIRLNEEHMWLIQG